jgi:hypothetical protein
VKTDSWLGVVVLVMLVGGAADAADRHVTFEIGVGNITPSSSSSSTWGWWNPSKYDVWDPDEGDDFGLTDLRLLVGSRDYTVLLAGERYPTLNAVGTYQDPATGDTVTDSVNLESWMIDLGLGRWLGRDMRNGGMPWIGLTYMRIDEQLTPGTAAGSGGSSDTASSGLWGIAAGADGSITVWKSLDITGRLLVRWATGTRKATVSAGGSGSAEVDDSIDHFMWGLDAGLRWHAAGTIALEIGWRLRDRTLDDGPASFGGPQLKAVFEF